VNAKVVNNVIEEIERLIEIAESERKIREYCAGAGLNADNASDYSKAAIAVLDYERPGNAPGWKRNENPGTLGLLNSNHALKMLDGESDGYYNDCNTIDKLAVLYERARAISFHGCFWEKAAKAVVPRRVVINRAPVRIAVAGNVSKEGGGYKTVYLYNGQRSDDYLWDADAVVILPGQKYYAPGGGGILTEGAIKVRNSWFTAEVSMDLNGVMSANASGAEYYEPAAAKRHLWIPPKK
jgi:hypothetical protein